MSFFNVIIFALVCILVAWILPKILKNMEPKRRRFNSLEQERAYEEELGRQKARKDFQGVQRQPRGYDMPGHSLRKRKHGLGGAWWDGN